MEGGKAGEWEEGDEEKKKERRTRSQAFRQTAYVPPRWLFHLVPAGASESEQSSQETLTNPVSYYQGTCYESSVWLLLPKPVSVLRLKPGNISARGVQRRQLNEIKNK